MEKTLLQKLDSELPPFWCAALARKNPRGKAAGQRLISERSGISYRTVQRISVSVTWSGYMEYASPFIQACGLRVQSKMTIFRMNEIRVYLRWCKDEAVTPMAHLGTRQWLRFNQLAALWGKAHREDCKDQTPSAAPHFKSLPKQQRLDLKSLNGKNQRLNATNGRLRWQVVLLKVRFLHATGSPLEEISKTVKRPVSEIEKMIQSRQ